MRIAFVEAGNGVNWGKFAVGRFDATEWRHPAAMSGTVGASLVRTEGWTPRSHAWVLDLATGEGAYFTLGGYAAADLIKHRIWVCPLYEPFLGWLYQRYRDDPDGWFDALPPVVELSDAPALAFGYRRPGPVVARRFGRRWAVRLIPDQIR